MPDSPFSRSLDAAVGYFELGMVDDALGELDRLPPELAHEPEALELKVAIGQQTGRWELATTALETLCGQPGACVDLFVDWGCALYELGRVRECREALMKAPAERTEHGLWHYHLACYESLLGATEAARQLLRRALELEPCLQRMAEANDNLQHLLPTSPTAPGINPSQRMPSADRSADRR